MLPKFVTVVHSSFYKTARTCSEPSSVERWLSFAVEVMTASANWKHPLPLKIIYSACFQWLLRFRNGWQLLRSVYVLIEVSRTIYILTSHVLI